MRDDDEARNSGRRRRSGGDLERGGKESVGVRRKAYGRAVELNEGKKKTDERARASSAECFFVPLGVQKKKFPNLRVCLKTRRGEEESRQGAVGERGLRD